MSLFPSWPVLEQRLAASPKLGVGAVCQRATARMMPIIARAEVKYGTEAIEWMNAIVSVVHLLEAGCLAVPISRLTWDLAAEIARGTANSARSAVQEKGPSPFADEAELVFAGAAFAVEGFRAKVPEKIASMSARSLKMLLDSGVLPQQLVAFDLQTLTTLAAAENTDWDPTANGPFGELWPHGEPEWFSTGMARVQELEANLPKFLRLPGW